MFVYTEDGTEIEVYACDGCRIAQEEDAANEAAYIPTDYLMAHIQQDH